MIYTGKTGAGSAGSFVQGATWEEAMDLAQEAYVKLFQNLDEVHTPETWVRVTARRYLLRLRHRNSQEMTLILNAACWHPEWCIQPIILSEEAERVLKILQALPPRQRDVMAWTIDGYRPREIAKFLELEPNTVSASLRLARQRLKELLFGETGPAGGES